MGFVETLSFFEEIYDSLFAWFSHAVPYLYSLCDTLSPELPETHRPHLCVLWLNNETIIITTIYTVKFKTCYV